MPRRYRKGMHGGCLGVLQVGGRGAPPDGPRLGRVHYGVLVRDWVYRVQYQAAARYYFDKDLATFERVRESFRVTDKAS